MLALLRLLCSKLLTKPAAVSLVVGLLVFVSFTRTQSAQRSESNAPISSGSYSSTDKQQFAGTPGHVTASSVINFAELAEREKLSPAKLPEFRAIPEPMPIPQNLPVPSGQGISTEEPSALVAPSEALGPPWTRRQS